MLRRLVIHFHAVAPRVVLVWGRPEGIAQAGDFGSCSGAACSRKAAAFLF
ncbi:hypothetical protein ppKF707_0408 [Metapseudomonas furukawaii]|nr:hypothetical protein ppKF707_0408 [Pseudomonas furukawaii]